MNSIIPVINMKDFVISFHPLGKTAKFSKPITILKAAKMMGLNISGPCGGSGKCGKCKIRFVKFPGDRYLIPDSESKRLLTDSELKKGYRLACMTQVKKDVELELPPWSLELSSDGAQDIHEILVDGKISEGVESQFPPEPSIKILHCKLPLPTLDDNISDLERLKRCINKDLNVKLNKIEFSHSLLSTLTQRLHENDWQVDTVVGINQDRMEVLDLFPYQEPKEDLDISQHRYYGLALDIGTSTIVAYLLDLVTGNELSVASAVNPQVRIGADVITRIRYSMQGEDNEQQLSDILRETINKLIRQLCEKTDIEKELIFDCVALGNPTMLFNLLNVPITTLGTAPYTPVLNDGYNTYASELSLVINKRGMVYLGPVVSGFLGADALGTAIVTKMLDFSEDGDEKSKVKLAIDIGTNGEILLSNNNRLIACSASAGPAFEVGNLQFGIRATPGAVYQIRIKNKKIKYLTIDGKYAIGITGSGVVDGINEFLRVGAIRSNGAIDQDTYKKWLKYPKRIKLKHTMEPTNGCDLILPELMIVPKNETSLDTAITITQNDIREIQLAKAAIRTGIEILLGELELEANDIDELYLAGAFGNYIRPKSAMGIKLLPMIELKRIIPIGNAAGSAAKIFLRSQKARRLAEKIAKNMEYIDLATHPKFQDLFVENMNF